MTDLCPKCGSGERYTFKRRKLMRCKACGTSYTATSGTIFSGTKLGDEKRTALVSLIANNPTISSQTIADAIGVSLKTAWLWKVRVLAGQDAAKGYFQGNRKAAGRTKAIWKRRHADPWTKYRHSMFESMWARGCPITCMAAMFGVQPGTISNRAKYHDLPSRRAA